MKGIIWLASYPKSGNTWLRAFLANVIADSETPVPFSDYWRYATSEASGHWYKSRLGDLSQADMRAIARMRTEVQREIAATGNPLRFVKTHNYLGPAFGHLQINMDVTAGAIYIIRNPLDVAISFANHISADIDRAIDLMAKPGTSTAMRADRVFEWTSDWSTHVKSWTARPHGQLCVLRYEDILDDPVKCFSKVVQFVGLDTDEERVARAVEASSFRQLQQMEKDTGFDEKPGGAEVFFRAGKKDQWRDALTTEQQRRITARHKEQMKRFGYL